MSAVLAWKVFIYMLRTTFTICAICAIFLTILLVLPPSGAAFPHDLEQVSLQLDWKYQFEYAGFIVAKEKGFYTTAGLDVALLEYQPKTDIIADVLSQKANYGSHNSSLVISEGRIQPTVLMATYLQRSPLIMIAKKEIKEPIDLIGTTIMLTMNEIKYSSLALLLNKFGINHNTNTIVEHTFSIQDFIDGKIDAMSTFRTNQIYDLNKLNIPHSIIDPADFGFVMTAVNIFTSKAESIQHPERTRRFIEASNRGWKYALDHRDEVVQLIHTKYAPNKTIEALTFEANITNKMLLRDLYPIGSVNKELTLRTYNQLRNIGRIADGQNMDQVLLFDDEKNNQINFSADELDYLAKKQEITMCVDPDWMPFEQIKNGAHSGIAADYMAMFQKQLPIPIRLIPTQTWQESIHQAQERNCDILSLAASTTTRTKYMNFTPPYISLPVVIATTNDKIFINNIDDIAGEKVGIVRGYAIGEEMRSRHPQVEVIDVDSIRDGLQRVENGELYCYIDNLMAIADQIQKNFTGSIKICGRLDVGYNQVNLSVATRNDEPELREIFTKLVLSVTPEEKQAIYNKWVTIKQIVSLDYQLLWSLLGVFGVISAFYAAYAFQLHRYNKALLKLSETDTLTGLYNRCKLDELLHEKHDLFLRYNSPCGVAILDIDHFKQINDTFGHQTGDTVLVELAALM